MNNQRNKYILLFTLIAAVFTSCKNQWDSHDTITDPALGVTVLQQINNNADLSKFSQYLAQTGYDKVIAGSKTFTVWAPTNAAITAALTIDATIATDTGKLKRFVGNHISYQLYPTSLPQPSVRVKMLNGKSITFTKTKFEDANIVLSNIYSSNGLLHTIDQAIIPKLNIWDYIKSLTTVGAKQRAYLLSQNYLHQDTTRAKQIGVDALTGRPIYDPTSAIDTLNYYISSTQNIKSEDKQFTYFVLTDAAFDAETNKVLPYFATAVPQSSTLLANYNVTKDLAIPGLITLNNLPDTIISPFNVKVPINKANIVQTYNASNGIVYVISSVPYRLKDKITPIVIQGESTIGFSRSDKAGNILYRTKLDNNGVPFSDIFIETNGTGTLTALFSALYFVPNMNSVSYKVYWRAINDRAVAFSQQLNFGTSTAATFPYTLVPLLNYSETLIGTYTVTQYGSQFMFLTGANNTTSGTNSLSLDYVKLIPVLP
ncbi:MAG: fasciclin domain-containing protein [Mucilaginibacter sp.]|uniref:fasciclin domain-containing protein n=1 Tax=Mucilaginibacter sp. TaxID=1882438 RepID=UPI003264C726